MSVWKHPIEYLFIEMFGVGGNEGTDVEIIPEDTMNGTTTEVSQY